MMRSYVLAAIVGAFAAMSTVSVASAGGSGASQGGAVHPKSDYYRGGSQGRSGRRGGYSYTYEDSINTYGDSRGRSGSASSFRDHQLERQTEAGPFDHGFFFDSGNAPHGGDSPYMN